MGYRNTPTLAASAVVIPACTLVSKRFQRWVLLEVLNRLLQIFQQQTCKISAYTIAGNHTLHDQIASVRRHGIRGHLPTLYPETVRKIIESKPMIVPLLQRPRASRNSAAPVINKLEHSNFFYFIRQPCGNVGTILCNFRVSLPSKPDQVIVLRYDLPSGPREVQRKCRHISAEVLHAENQLLRQIAGFTPDGPATAQRSKTELVSGSIDGFDSGQAKVPYD